MSDESKFKAAMRRLHDLMYDPANRAPCVDCEGEGYLFTKSGKQALCDACDGDGTVMIRDPLMNINAGGVLGGSLAVKETK